MKLKIFFPVFPICFMILGILFILVFSPKLVSAERKIQQIGTVKLLIPKDIKVTIFAKDVLRARHMAFDDQGILFLSQTREGKVVALPDFDKNGVADQKASIISGHKSPHGLAFANYNNNYYLLCSQRNQGNPTKTYS